MIELEQPSAGELGFDITELEFISRYMEKPELARLWPVSRLGEYIDYITSVRNKIRGYTQQKIASYSESDYFGLAQFDLHNSSFQYSYQRYDLVNTAPDLLEKIYNISLEGFVNNGLFLTSGMAALLVTILALRQLCPYYKRIKFSKHSYFETSNLLTKSFDCFEACYFEDANNQDADIVVLDSSAMVLPSKDQWINAKVIIVDTSCWEVGSAMLVNLLAELREFEGIIVLVRSHIKLDCFGLELNRLGSLIILSSSRNISNAKLNSQIFEKTCKEINSSIGSNFYLRDYYPWLFDQEFYMLSAQRTANIRARTKIIIDILLEIDLPNIIINKIQHGLFFSFRYLRNKINDPIIKYTQEICAIANKLGIALVPAPSFALCCTAFDGYRSKIDNEVYFRVAPTANMSLDHTRELAYFLANFFSKQ